MTTHGENIGSRKVEPATNELPKWRLHANFLLRELARMWYGQKGIFDLCYGHDEGSPFWREFVALFGDMARLFGEEQCLTRKEMDARLYEAIVKWEQWHGGHITFSKPYYEARWYAIHMLGEDMANTLIDTAEVDAILGFVFYAFTFAAKGKLPPYGSFARLQPLEYYEALPVDPGLEDRYYNNEPLPF